MKVYWIAWFILVMGFILNIPGRTRQAYAMAALALQTFALGMLIATVLIGWMHWPAS